MIYEILVKILHTYASYTYIHVLDTKKIYGVLNSDYRIWQMLLLHYSQYLTRSG